MLVQWVIVCVTRNVSVWKCGESSIISASDTGLVPYNYEPSESDISQLLRVKLETCHGKS